MLRLSRAAIPITADAAEIRVGDRFREIANGGHILRVAALIAPRQGCAHARLRRIDDPARVITIACVALRDPRTYVRLARRPGHRHQAGLMPNSSLLSITEGEVR